MKIVFATNNLNKLKEVRKALPQVEILSLKDINCNEELPETQATIEGNAKQKAEYVFNNYGYACFADDTGLLIDALNGEPGVYSARYAGPNCNSEDNMQKVLSKLKNQHERSAHFKTVIHYKSKENSTSFSGLVDGEITNKKIGQDGFGYDPIFQPTGFESTFSQMTMEQKNNISHRGKAVRKLAEFLNNL